MYLNPRILKLARDAGVPITLGDAHTPDRLGQCFDDAIANARKAGFKDYVAFAGRKPAKIALP